MSNQVNTGQAMVQCPVCKTLLPAGSRFCPNDGTPLTETAALSGVPTPTPSLPSTTDMELPTIVGGRYRLVAIRGGGGMARVYQAVDQTLEREVAVKLINPQLRSDPEFDARFQREARIASKLNDPHIVVVHDFGIDPAHGPYLVMEFLQGQSLREHLQTKGPLPYKATLQMAGQLLLALIHAHGQGIIHRDLKPDNLFLVNISGVRLHVRVLDFGIARILNRDVAGHAPLTSPGAILGTPRYMSPEQLAGLPLDARSDLYSAALVIFEALTGELPHARSKDLLELCPEASPQLRDLLNQCLDSNPDKRPSSALEAFLQLQEMGKASGVLLLPAGSIERLAEARRQAQGLLRAPGASDTTVLEPTPAPLRNRLLIGVGVALVLVGFLLLLRYLVFSPGPSSDAGVETLLGVKIGDEQQGAIDRLKLTRSDVLNPFATGRPAYLGHALKPEDLGLEPAALARLDVRRTADERICILFADGKVRAIVAREPASAATGRGIALGGTAKAIYDRYPEERETADVKVPVENEPGKARHVEVRRYDKLGVAIEVSGSKVSGLALYPPQP
jgi:serine/threonine-protein kinase